MRYCLVPGLGAILLTACNATGPAPAPQESRSAGTPPSAAAAVPVPIVAPARHEKVENDLIDFDYAYPANAASIPSLKALLDADIARRKANLVREARGAQKDAKAGGWEYHALGYWVDWQTVTDLPGWLSLSTEVGTFEGGAHPNSHFDTILWDRQAGRRRDPSDLFVSKAALSRAITRDFCAALDVQRREKRGEDWKLDGGIDEFDGCIDPLANGTLILGSSNHRAFDRLGVLVPPYNAGPYAEGSYEVTLPVTAAVMAAVRPEFRTSFVIKR